MIFYFNVLAYSPGKFYRQGLSGLAEMHCLFKQYEKGWFYQLIAHALLEVCRESSLGMNFKLLIIKYFLFYFSCWQQG